MGTLFFPFILIPRKNAIYLFIYSDTSNIFMLHKFNYHYFVSVNITLTNLISYQLSYLESVLSFIIPQTKFDTSLAISCRLFWGQAALPQNHLLYRLPPELKAYRQHNLRGSDMPRNSPFACRKRYMPAPKQQSRGQF